MHHIFALLFACSSIAIFLIVLFRTKNKNIEEIPCVFDDEHLPEELIPDDHFQDTLWDPETSIDEMINLNQEMGLYDEPKEHFYNMIGIFVEGKNNITGEEFYYISGYVVTKEGYQWAKWVYGINQP